MREAGVLLGRGDLPESGLSLAAQLGLSDLLNQGSRARHKGQIDGTWMSAPAFASREPSQSSTLCIGLPHENP